MKKQRASSASKMRKYYQLILVIVCFVSVISLLVYRHEYYRLRYVLEVLNIFGKSGISDIEYCGAGFNATLLTEILVNSSHAVRDTAPLFQQIDDNFYTYSSFLRHNLKYDTLSPGFVYETDTIAVGRSNIEPKFRCNIWIEELNRPKPAKFIYKTISEEDGYQVYIFQCLMSKDFGKPVGISFYSNDRNANPMQGPVGQLIHINTKKQAQKDSNVKFYNNVEIAACVIPNEIPIVSKSALIEFLTFHQMMGIQKFIIYDSTITEDIIKRINMLPEELTKWSIKFFPLNYPFVFNKSYKTIRKAVALDCMFRNLQIDKEIYTKVSHLVTLSWDEYIVPRYHQSLKALFREFEPFRKQKKMEMLTLNFCMNQKNDEKINDDYPTVVKKTVFYKIPSQHTKHVTITNLDAVNSFSSISDSTKNKTIPEDVLAVHKYNECNVGESYNTDGEKLGIYPHKFEGAMLKFAEAFHNNKIYRLFKTGNIWERPSNLIHDGL